MKTSTKYQYEKIIQQNYGDGWEDVSSYDCNSQGVQTKEERNLLKNDIKEYVLTGYATRSIFRKTLK